MFLSTMMSPGSSYLIIVFADDRLKPSKTHCIVRHVQMTAAVTGTELHKTGCKR